MVTLILHTLTVVVWWMVSAVLAIIAKIITKSTAKNGEISCIVPLVSHVDHTIHEIHALITEQGVADLRGLDPIERAKTIIENCAHPKFKQELYDYLDKAINTCEYKEMPVDIEDAYKFPNI